MVYDAINEWYFGGTEDEWSVWVTNIYWRSLGLDIDTPEKINIIMTKSCSCTRCPLRSHSLVCIEKYLFILGIVPICDKEL